MKKLMFLFSAGLVVAALASCGNKTGNGNSVADSDSVATDTASIDSVSAQTTQQIATDSAAMNNGGQNSGSQN